MKDTDALRKARALLANAEDPNIEAAVAEIFFAKAMEIIAKYGIDEALLEARADIGHKPGNRTFRAYGGNKLDQLTLIWVIAKFNRCRAVRTAKIIDGRREAVCVVVGFEADIDIVELLFTSLKLQADQRLARIRGSSGGQTRQRRVGFFAGFNDAIKHRLEEAQRAAEQEAGASTPGTDLVLRDRSLAVQDAFSSMFPHTKKSTSRRVHRDSFNAGHEHGLKANLHNRPSAGSGSRKEIG